MAASKVKKTDNYGIFYKFPNRDCSQCANYPCFIGMDKCRSNFAAYGCKEFKVNDSISEVSSK